MPNVTPSGVPAAAQEASPPTGMPQQQARAGTNDFEALLPVASKVAVNAPDPGNRPEQPSPANLPVREQAAAGSKQQALTAVGVTAQPVVSDKGKAAPGQPPLPDITSQQQTVDAKLSRPDRPVAETGRQSLPVPMTQPGPAGNASGVAPRTASAATISVPAAHLSEGVQTAAPTGNLNSTERTTATPAGKTGRRDKADDPAAAIVPAAISPVPAGGPAAQPSPLTGDTQSSTAPKIDPAKPQSAAVPVIAGATAPAAVMQAAPGDSAGLPPTPPVAPVTPGEAHDAVSSKASDAAMPSPLIAGDPVRPAALPDGVVAPPAAQAARPAGTAGEQVAMHVAQALSDGEKTVTVELHPADMGRVEIRLSFHSDGMSMRMTVDRPETFDAFSRDRSGLEQQLAQAGVDFAGGGLDLRLGQQSGQPEGYSNARNSRVPMQAPLSETAPATLWAGTGLIDILA